MLRLATKDDLSEVLRMTEEFHKASPYSDIPYSKKKVIEYFEIFLRDPTKVMVILSIQNEKPRGMIVGLCDSPPFSEVLVTTELAWWMDLEYRNSRDSIHLMRAYEDWGNRVGAGISQMSLLSTSPDLRDFYERSGYQMTEHSYIKKLEK